MLLSKQMTLYSPAEVTFIYYNSFQRINNNEEYNSQTKINIELKADLIPVNLYQQSMYRVAKLSIHRR